MSDSINRIQLGVRISEELYWNLVEDAKENGRTVRQSAIFLLEKHFKEGRKDESNHDH